MNMVFGRFDFTPETGELRRDGRPVKLQAQPAKVLAVLVAHPGEIVTRETLQRELWGSDTHVDFERGLNYCIAQVRSALGDSPDSPTYIETVPKQGYRFLAPLTQSSAPGPVTPAPSAPARASHPTSLGIAVTAGLLVLVFSALSVTFAPAHRRPAIAVIPFYNETGRPDLDWLAKGISDATVVQLATPERLRQLQVIGNDRPLLNPFARQDVQSAARAAGASWVVIGQLKGDRASLRVIGHLIRVSDMKHVWAGTFDDPSFDLDAQSSVAESIAAKVAHAVATN